MERDELYEQIVNTYIYLVDKLVTWYMKWMGQMNLECSLRLVHISNTIIL